MTTGLAREWRERLPTHGYVDLTEDKALDGFPELRDAVRPPRFELAFSDTSYIAADGDDDLAAELAAELIPPDHLAVEQGGQGWVHIELATIDAVGAIHTLDIPAGIQAAGLGSLVIAQLAELGDRLGLEALELEAGKIGRWAWMRCGFDFTAEEDRTRVVEAAQRFASKLGREVDLGQIVHSWDFLTLDEPVTASEIERAGGPPISPAGTSVPLGKALLLGPGLNENAWLGRLTLDADNEGCVRLRSYVRLL